MRRGSRGETKHEKQDRNENPIVQTQFQSSVCSSQEPRVYKEHFVPAAEAHGIWDGGECPLPSRRLSVAATKGLFSPTLDMHPTQIPSISADLVAKLRVQSCMR